MSNNLGHAVLISMLLAFGYAYGFNLGLVLLTMLPIFTWTYPSIKGGSLQKEQLRLENQLLRMKIKKLRREMQGPR